MTPYYDDGTCTIYHADALDVLRATELAIDAVVTDPPYASGSRKEGGRAASGSMLRGEHIANARLSAPIDLDQMTTTGFVWTMREVALAAYDSLIDGGSFLSFIDWRQWPQLVGALESCNLRVQTMIVWDKGAMGLGNGFRNQHELVCHASKGVPIVHNKSTGNVLASKRDRPDDIGHPSPKPVGLMARLIEVACPPGGLVVDPFMGSGSTLLAARSVGRRCIGIEKSVDYCQIAVKRLEQGVLDFGPSA